MTYLRNLNIYQKRDLSKAFVESCKLIKINYRAWRKVGNIYYSLVSSTYLRFALHLYLRIVIAATSIVKTTTAMFISSMLHFADCKSFSGTWYIVPFTACQNQTICLFALGSICKNLYGSQKSISTVSQF